MGGVMTHLLSCLRRVYAATAILVAAGCTTDLSPEVARQPIGDFRLEHLVVVVDDPFSPAVSRKTTDAALKAAVEEAVGARLGRFTGAGSYSIGIKVSGYVLAPRALPILFAPPSQLYLNVLAYDATPERLNAEPRQLIVNERAGGDTVIGSGYTQSAEEQLAELADNAAIEIEKWLRENADWFVPGPAAPAPDAGADSGA